jgi:hypothetical protein
VEQWLYQTKHQLHEQFMQDPNKDHTCGETKEGEGGGGGCRVGELHQEEGVTLELAVVGACPRSCVRFGSPQNEDWVALFPLLL